MATQPPQPRFTRTPTMVGIGIALGTWAIALSLSLYDSIANSNEPLNASISPIAAAQAQTLPQITSVSHDALANRNSGDLVLVTVRGTPNSQGSVLLIEDTAIAVITPLQEIAPGVYLAKTRPSRAETIVVARLQQGTLKTVMAASTPIGPVLSSSPSPTPTPTPTASATPAASVALKPVFTSPKDGDKLRSKGFKLTGQTRPAAIVQITVVATLPKLGGIISLGTETLLDQSVTADAKGQFQVDVPPPSVLGAGTRYAIKAIAQDRNDSATTQITVEQR
jgi:hypothetical protein